MKTNTKNIALKVAATIFLIIAVLHLARLVLRLQVTVAHVMVPLMASILGFIIPLGLAIWLFKVAKRK